MIDWLKPIRRKRTGEPARFIGMIHRTDGLNYVVATRYGSDPSEYVGTYTAEGTKKDGPGKWDLENYDG